MIFYTLIASWIKKNLKIKYNPKVEDQKRALALLQDFYFLPL